jgi:hypothetical protein
MVSPASSNWPTTQGGEPAGAPWYASGRAPGADSSTHASRMDLTCVAITDSTSMLMRLNSSKQPHAPVCASPLKMSAIVW